MAHGITQIDVDRAADALLQAGERPTIERVRQFLGTGSPNTVTRLLDIWWQGLGSRLQDVHQKIVLPDAPAAVSKLASQLWEEALVAATRTAQDAVQVERQAVEAERTRLDQEAAVLRQQVEDARELVAQAEAARAEAGVRVQDLQHLTKQQSDHVAELARQRDEAAGRTEQAQMEASTWRQRLETAQAQFRSELEAQSTHLRAVEERAYGEVDRLRQEIKALTSTHRADTDRRDRRLVELEAMRAGLQQELDQTARQLVAERAKREVLEQQLTELQQALQITLRAPKTPARKTAPKSANSRRRPKKAPTGAS